MSTLFVPMTTAQANRIHVETRSVIYELQKCNYQFLSGFGSAPAAVLGWLRELKGWSTEFVRSQLPDFAVAALPFQDQSKPADPFGIYNFGPAAVAFFMPGWMDPLNNKWIRHITAEHAVRYWHHFAKRQFNSYDVNF
jgi:hypothetical protein